MAPSPFTDAEIAHLRRFFAEGGVLFVDDSLRIRRFSRVQRELGGYCRCRPILIGTEHVVSARSTHSPPLWGATKVPKLEAIGGGNVQVVQLDLAGLGPVRS
jgi:hypothetical protein